MKKFINPILRLGTAVALLSVIYMQNNKINELTAKTQVIEKVAPLAGDVIISKRIDSLENVVDSVVSENLVVQIQNGRYEVALELLKEEDKKAADKFERILTTQTE